MTVLPAVLPAVLPVAPSFAASVPLAAPSVPTASAPARREHRTGCWWDVAQAGWVCAAPPSRDPSSC